MSLCLITSVHFFQPQEDKKVHTLQKKLVLVFVAKCYCVIFLLSLSSKCLPFCLFIYLFGSPHSFVLPLCRTVPIFMVIEVDWLTDAEMKSSVLWLLLLLTLCDKILNCGHGCDSSFVAFFDVVENCRQIQPMRSHLGWYGCTSANLVAFWLIWWCIGQSDQLLVVAGCALADATMLRLMQPWTLRKPKTLKLQPKSRSRCGMWILEMFWVHEKVSLGDVCLFWIWLLVVKIETFIEYQHISTWKSSRIFCVLFALIFRYHYAVFHWVHQGLALPSLNNKAGFIYLRFWLIRSVLLMR